MKANKDSSASLNITGIIVLACLVLTTLCLGIYGFSIVYVVKANIVHAELTRWFDVLYSTIKLFSLISSPAEDTLKHWAISTARFTAACSVFFTIAFATFYAAGNWLKTNLLVRYYKQHYIVFGLNEESSYLINDLLEKKEKVVIVEYNYNNPLLLKYKKKRVTVILGDGSDISVQLKASILKAKAMIAITSCDLTNLAILRTLVESTHKPKLHCYIGIENVMSYKLFEPDAFYSIENIKKQSTGLLINVFNLNELAAIDLIQTMGFASNADTVSNASAPVSVLITGFGTIGEAILREVLLLSHFCNHKKAKITVLTAEAHDFFITHHQVLVNCNGKGLNLWDIEFVTSEDEIQSPSSFNHIIACDENTALKTILRFYDFCTLKNMQEKDNTTTFHYYSALKHDIKHQQIKPFGSLKTISSYSQLLNGKNEMLAQRSHELYAKSELGIKNLNATQTTQMLEQHDQKLTNSSQWLHWINQPLFKRRSNFTEKRHFQIKLLALGGDIPNEVLNKEDFLVKDKMAYLPFLEDFSDLDLVKIQNWMVYIKKQVGLSNEQLTERINALVRAEHNRWNAFHIVNNWRYGEVKNEALKTHDCLLSWEELEKKRPETIKYDYQNIYHIPESLALIKR